METHLENVEIGSGCVLWSIGSRLTFVLGILLTSLLLFAQPTAAFFNNECDKPRATYEKFLDSAKRLKLGEDRRNSLQEQRRQQYASAYKKCQRNPDKFFRQNNIDPDKYVYGATSPFECWYWYQDVTSVRVSVSTPLSSDEYRRAMQVVRSYKNCFDPEVYISALEWLRRNK
jgi:hypothetical protein